MDIQILRSCRFSGVDYSSGLYTAALGNAYSDTTATFLVAQGVAKNLTGVSTNFPLQGAMNANNNLAGLVNPTTLGTMNLTAAALVSAYESQKLENIQRGDPLLARAVPSANIPTITGYSLVTGASNDAVNPQTQRAYFFGSDLTGGSELTMAQAKLGKKWLSGYSVNGYNFASSLGYRLSSALGPYNPAHSGGLSNQDYRPSDNWNYNGLESNVDFILDGDVVSFFAFTGVVFSLFIDGDLIANGGTATTTGGITTGTPALTLASIAGISAGTKLRVIGAGTAGVDLYANVLSLSGLIATLDTNAGTTVAGAVVTATTFVLGANMLYDSTNLAFNPQTPGHGYVTLKFPTVAIRRITVSHAVDSIGDLWTRAVSTVKPASYNKMQWVHFGDSFSFVGIRGLTSYLRSAFGRDIDFINCSLGATSFTDPALIHVGATEVQGILPSHYKVFDKMWQYDSPKVITYLGGHNESSFTSAQITLRVTEALTAIRAKFPSAIIICFTANVDPALIASGFGVSTEKNMLNAISALNLNIYTVPMQTGDRGAWLSGTGNTGTPTGTGNTDIYTSGDTVHPSPAGHKATGLWMANRMYEILKANMLQ